MTGERFLLCSNSGQRKAATCGVIFVDEKQFLRRTSVVPRRALIVLSRELKVWHWTDLVYS